MASTRRTTWAALTWAGALAATVGAAEPLYYRFGRHLSVVYEQRVRQLEPPGPTLSRQVRLVFIEQRGDQWLALLDQIEVGPDGPASIEGLIFEVDPRGGLRFDADMLDRVGRFEEALTVIPPLRPPHDAAAGWTSRPDPFGRRLVCEPAVVDPNRGGALRVRYACEDVTGADAFLHRRQAGTLWFDPQMNLLSFGVRRTFGADGRLTRQVATRLHQLTPAHPEMRPSLAVGRDAWLRLVRLDHEVLGRLRRAEIEMDAASQLLRRQTSSALREVSDKAGPFARLTRGRARRLPEDLLRYARQAEIARNWIEGLPSTWSLQDPNGRTVRSETLPRPRLECFWSGADAVGLRTLAALRDVRSLAGDRGVALLGMNIDADPQLAQRAVQACGGGLDHVLAEPLAPAGARQFGPVFRHIDAQGRVTWTAFGWRPSLRPLILGAAER